MSWDDLFTLSALIRTGSFAACAREMGINHATAIRRIRRLEQALGQPVATRSDSAFTLTRAGVDALAAARQMERTADRLLHTLEGASGGASGTVRIAATAAVGSHYLTPRLPTLYRANPELDVRFELEDRIASLAKRRAHIAVRLARPREDSVVARRVGTLRFGLYAAEHLAVNADTPLCSLHEEQLNLPEVTWPQRQARRVTYQSNSQLAVREAVRAGLGVALLPHYLAADEPGLRRVEDVDEVTREIWLAYPEEFRDTARFRPVIEWLAACLGQCP